MFYTWNYDIRWAATKLRKVVRMKQAKDKKIPTGRIFLLKGFGKSFPTTNKYSIYVTNVPPLVNNTNSENGFVLFFAGDHFGLTLYPKFNAYRDVGLQYIYDTVEKKEAEGKREENKG